MKTKARILYFSTWAEGLAEASDHLAGLAARDLRNRVSDPSNPDLLRMARLDCDWDGECARCFAEMRNDAIEFLPAKACDPQGLLHFTASPAFDEATNWLVLIAQRPLAYAPVIGRLLEAFTRRGGRVLYWAFDEASRAMDCFATGVAPYLSVLIHDEAPLDAEGAGALPAACSRDHQSWVANVVPFAHAFDEQAEERVVFMGSRLGLTDHRRRQIEALERHFKDRFIAITDHSLPVAERGRFAGWKVHVCPEGRKFTTPAMSRTHTDRPFWAGCMGQVPVSEDSREGGRLDELAEAGLILRYPHGDLRAMIESCERALAMDVTERRRIYEHFNTHGTVGPVAARRIAEFHARESAGERLAVVAGGA